MSWWELLPGLLTMTVAVVAPGAIVLRAAGVRGILALGGGAAVSVALYGTTAIVLDRLGVTWSWPPVLVALTAAVGLAALLGGWGRRTRRARGSAPDGLADPDLRLDRRGAAWVGGAVAVSALLLALPIARGMVAPDALMQHWDGVYHVSGVQAILDTGNASSLGAMAPLYGEVSPTVYYPAAWHGIVALAPGFASVAAAANASTFVFGVVVWLLGMAALGRTLLGGDPRRTALVVVLGAGFSAFPVVILSTLAQWPFGAGIAVIPGVLALMVAALRGHPGVAPITAPGRLVPTGVVLLTALAGVALAHASALFSALLLLVPGVVALLARGLARRWRTGEPARRRRVAVGTSVATVALVAGAAALLANPVVRNVLAYERDVDTPFYLAVLNTVLGQPLGWPTVGNLPVALLTIVGIVAVVRASLRRARTGAPDTPRDADVVGQASIWVVVAYVLVVALTALASGPPNVLRLLTGLWYTQAARVGAVLPVVAAPLAAVGALACARFMGTWATQTVGPVARRLRGVPVVAAASGLVVVLVVVTLGWFVPARTGRFEQAYVPEKIVWGTMVRAEEVELLRRMPQTTRADAVVLGDPRNGAAFTYSVAHRRAVFPQLAVQNLSADQRLLRERFADLDTEVCAAVERLGVTHFYLDTAGVADGAKVDVDAVGLLRAPESGVEVVDTAGTTTLYRITGC